MKISHLASNQPTIIHVVQNNIRLFLVHNKVLILGQTGSSVSAENEFRPRGDHFELKL